MDGKAGKKRIKAQAKREKKRLKAEVKAGRPAAAPASTSRSAGSRFTDGVRGALYLVLGGSLLVALVLGQRGAVTGLDELVDSLFVAWTGKILLAVVGLALTLYGLRLVRKAR